MMQKSPLDMEVHCGPARAESTRRGCRDVFNNLVASTFRDKYDISETLNLAVMEGLQPIR